MYVSIYIFVYVFVSDLFAGEFVAASQPDFGEAVCKWNWYPGGSIKKKSFDILGFKDMLTQLGKCLYKQL